MLTILGDVACAVACGAVAYYLAWLFSADWRGIAKRERGE